MATYSSILAWRIPWTEEPVGPKSLGSQELDMTEQLTLSLSHKDLLYSTGNSTQYSVMTCMEKESKKVWIYLYVLLIHFQFSSVQLLSRVRLSGIP